MQKEEQIQELLTRNVEEVIDKDHLTKALAGTKKLRVKLGIDPTSPDLHLGHAVVLHKLREFQKLGHKAVLIIGDFTARIGDPSGRDRTRPPLSEKDIQGNMKHYLAQAGKIIDIKKAEVCHNSKWLGKLRGPEILELLSHLSVQQITEREDFKTRLKENKSIRLHELFYPVMVAYDSIAIKADVELGGNDQLFNLLTGRVLMERKGLAPQDILTVPLLVGLDGEKKMSKSVGNYIGLGDIANDMFGKIMSLSDALIGPYFNLCTELDRESIKTILEEPNPRDQKVKLGFEIVKLYHGEKKAMSAQENFEKLFSKKEIPSDIPELKVAAKISVLDLVMKSGKAKSKSEARRLIEQGAVAVNDVQKKNPMEELAFLGGEVAKIGKKDFFKIKV